MTDSVRQLVAESGYPNMKVIQFAFDPEDIGGSNEYLPHNYTNNCVVYTGTHDNETVNGWFLGLNKEHREHIRTYLRDRDTANKWMYKKLIDLAMMCCADTCIVPVQDWLGLDNTTRMNTPGTVDINWSWRLLPEQLSESACEEMREVTKRFGRANWDALNRLEKAQKVAETEE